MKFKKLLLTLPAISLATPVMINMTSCSETLPLIEGDLAKYIKASKPTAYRVNSSYCFDITIKDEYINKVYLPESLNSIQCGDTTVYSLYEAEDDVWFSYIVNDYRYRATIYINKTPGLPKLNFEVSKITGLKASMADSYESKAYFNVGETFNTNNIVVNALFSDGSQMELAKSDYTVTSDWNNHAFVDADVGQTKTVNVKYSDRAGEYSASYTAKCVKATAVRFNDMTKEDGDERYATIADAIAAYNSKTDEGKYLIRIMPNTAPYEITDTLTINQNENDKQLIITTYGFVTFDCKVNNAISIVGDDNVVDSSVEISGIEFNAPTSGITDKWNFINCNKASNVLVEYCSFNGNENCVEYANAVKSTDSYWISIKDCWSELIRSYLDGTILSGEDTSYFDFEVSDCEAENQLILANVTGTKLNGAFRGIEGSFMYGKQDAEKSSASSMITINGDGQFIVDDCWLTQLKKGSAASNSIVKLLSSQADVIKMIEFSDIGFEKLEDDTIHDLDNQSGQTWQYKYAVGWQQVENNKQIDFE